MNILEWKNLGPDHTNALLKAGLRFRVNENKVKYFEPGTRLRVVHLSLCPSCVTRKKIVRRKWPRESLGARTGARSTRKECFAHPGFHATIFSSRFSFASRTTDKAKDGLLVV